MLHEELTALSPRSHQSKHVKAQRKDSRDRRQALERRTQELDSDGLISSSCCEVGKPKVQKIRAGSALRYKSNYRSFLSCTAFRIVKMTARGEREISLNTLRDYRRHCNSSDRSRLITSTTQPSYVLSVPLSTPSSQHLRSLRQYPSPRSDRAR